MSQTTPTTINNRLKVNNPPAATAADYLLTYNETTKEAGSISKTVLLKPLQKQIDEITNPDGFLKIGNVNQVGNTVSIPALEFEWKIKPVLFFTNEFFSTVIAPATDGYNRIDAIVANDFGGFTKIQGNESLTAAIQPNRPNNSLPVTFITVFGANIVAIAPPTEPVLTLQQIRETVNSLMDLKVDKAEGERLINAAEIDKLADQSGTNTGDEVLATDTVSGIVKTDVAVADPVVYLKETTDQLLKGKANYFLAVKPITGISYNVIIDDILNELLYDGTLPMNVIIPNNATVPFPVGTIFYTLGTNTGILSASGGAGVVLKVKTGISLSAIQNEVRQYTKIAVNTWSVRGDLNLGAVTQTELSYLQGATSNLQAQINAKTTLNGTPNYLMKFLTGATATVSRLFDNGTFFGIDTYLAPTKDFTLGNQSNRSIGIESSDKNTIGKDLTIEAGRTVNFDLNELFNLLQTSFNPTSYLRKNNGDFWAFYQGYVYKQTNGTGQFLYTTITGSALINRAVELNNLDIYGIGNSGFYKQTGGTGAFVLQTLNITIIGMTSIARLPNNDVYIMGSSGGSANFYKQTNGTGDWVFVESVVGFFTHMVASTLGNLYILRAESSNQLYKKVGSNAFAPEPGAPSYPRSLGAGLNGDIYVMGNNSTSIYKQTGGIGAFVFVSNSNLTNTEGNIGVNQNNDIFLSSTSVLYIKSSAGVGGIDLNGGNLKLKTGTGKGAGSNRMEFYTGQKTTSGSTMQTETLREYIDENGYHVYTSIPVYSDNAAAIAGGLPVGCEYRTATGQKMIVY